MEKNKKTLIKENAELLKALKELKSWCILNTGDYPAQLVNAMMVINEIEKSK